MTSPQTVFPLRLTGELDPDVGRWRWLFKWLLAIPHFVVLFFLWIGFVVSTVVAGFAILFTGRYPRGIFDFNVGVLRWSWRVGFYSYSALGTNKYLPFSLADDPRTRRGSTSSIPRREKRSGGGLDPSLASAQQCRACDKAPVLPLCRSHRADLPGGRHLGRRGCPEGAP